MPKIRKQKTSAARSDRRWWIWAAVAVFGVSAAALILLSNNSAEDGLRPGAAIGGVTYCQTVPKFALEMGYDTSAVMSTNEIEKGLVIYDRPLEPGLSPIHVYKHPTWDQAGYLGTPVNDEFGNIFVAPAPRVNLYDNPPEQQNTVFRVDTETGVMAEFVALPAAATMSSENPFGIIGLTYDCDTSSLYAASIAGSSRSEEAGIIFQVDAKTGEILSQLVDIDAFGLGVFNRALGKRLYFGLARTSEVWSVALDGDGKIRGRPRFEFSMLGWGSEGDEKARRIAFIRTNEMILRGSLFNYNLIAGSERPQTDYLLRYDPLQDIWLLSEDQLQ